MKHNGFVKEKTMNSQNVRGKPKRIFFFFFFLKTSFCKKKKNTIFVTESSRQLVARVSHEKL